jgi:methyl-accepting chemotaxis protein
LTEHYGLAFESEARAHHLVQATLVHLPDLTEALGRARARGTAYLVAQKLDQQEQTAIAVFAQTARMLQASTSLALGKALALDPALKAALAGAHQESVQQSAKVLALIEAEILRGSAPTHAGADYFAALTQAIDAQFRLLDRATEQLDATFQQRGSQQQLQLTLAFSGLAVLFLLVIAFGYAIAQAIARPLRQAVAVAREVAQGNLTVEVPAGGRDEIGQLLVALQEMTWKLRRLAGEVTQAARMVADTSAQIAQGNLDLSQRTEEQASTLEETASSMEELTSTVTQNADHAREASQLALGASEVARRGGQVVGEVVSTMDGITESSRRISEIIGVIDGIAFQTNILALNAAVEAARAGEQGPRLRRRRRRGAQPRAAQRVGRQGDQGADRRVGRQGRRRRQAGGFGGPDDGRDRRRGAEGERPGRRDLRGQPGTELRHRAGQHRRDADGPGRAAERVAGRGGRRRHRIDEGPVGCNCCRWWRASAWATRTSRSRGRRAGAAAPAPATATATARATAPAAAAAAAAAAVPDAPQRIRVKAPAHVPAAVLPGKRHNGSAPAGGEWTEF